MHSGFIFFQPMGAHMKQIDTSGMGFIDVRRDGKFYVDKSMLIADLLGTNDRGVYLFARPRRFGKTVNISMLDAFFNMEYVGNDWFDGLEISEHHEFDGYRNRYPVIHIDMKDVFHEGENPSYHKFIAKFAIAIRDSLRKFRYLLDSDVLFDDEKRILRSLLDMTADETILSISVKEICQQLETHHGRKVIVLIDEYDRAVTDTFGTDLQRSIIGFLGGFMSSTLKSNPSLQMAYITGVMQVAKAGMFSGVNNLSINNLFSKRSDERFGFTEDEVRDILEYYGHPERMPEVREWYDGYRFGDVDVYNPFSVMNYVSSGFIPNKYWANSGKNTPVRWMMDRSDRGTSDLLAEIVSGIPAATDIHQDMTYEDMRRSRSTDLYSLMVMTGYLKAVSRDDGRFDISVPNKEVMGLVEDVLRDFVPVDDGFFREFAIAVRDGEAREVESLLNGFLDGASYFDLKDESDYKLAIYLGLHAVIWRYDVDCERQKGNGRLDIILTPRDDSQPSVILELKKADDEASLVAEAEEGIRQIHERRYYHRMQGEVLLYGMAFWGVVPKVVLERIHL